MPGPENNLGTTLQVLGHYACMNKDLYLRDIPPVAVWMMDCGLGDGRREQNWKLRQEVGNMHVMYLISTPRGCDNLCWETAGQKPESTVCGAGRQLGPSIGAVFRGRIR